MSFQYPYALFALLAIPVLIIIYILRNRYKEETAPSTYIWEISEKFLKKKNPLRKIEHLITLIVQILAIFFMSFTLAKPTITLKGQADNIVFVLDASASMNMYNAKTNAGLSNENKKTRFVEAKEKIMETVNDAAKGSKFTLILADEEPGYVCKDISDSTQFEIYLNTATASEISCDLVKPLEMAQQLLSSGVDNKCIVASDKSFTNVIDNKQDNLEFIDVSDDTSINYAVNEFTYDIFGNQIQFSGSLINYNDKNPREVKIRFFVDDVNYGWTNVNNYVEDDTGKSVITETALPFVVTVTEKESGQLNKVKSVKVQIEDEDDALALDNVYYANDNTTSKTTNVLIVSTSSFYLETVMKSMKTINVNYKTVSSYSGQTGYDLYIFDCYNPNDSYTLPSDGSVMFFGSHTVVDKSGFLPQINAYKSLADGGVIKYANNDDDLLYKELTKASTMKEIDFNSFVPYTITGDFTTIMNYEDDNGIIYPMAFAGKNQNNQREVVFSFNLSNSSFPITYDFVNIMRNCLNYANPTTISSFEYHCGDEVTLSVSDDTTKIEIEDLNGNVEIVDIDDAEQYVNYTFSKTGNYIVRTIYDNETKREAKVFVALPKAESYVVIPDDTEINLVNNDNTIKGDGLFDNIIPYVIVASVLFGLDWILYAHEQY